MSSLRTTCYRTQHCTTVQREKCKTVAVDAKLSCGGKGARAHSGGKAQRQQDGEVSAFAQVIGHAARRTRFARIRVFGLLLVLTVCAADAFAQIDSGGIVNAASFRLAGLPDSGIAPGSIFTIFSLRARSIGPADPVQAVALPLPIELGHVSIQVTVGGSTVDCPLLFASASQVQALLPSNTNVGRGELRLSFGAQIFSEPIAVQRGTFGVFTQNQAGTGAAVVQNFMDASSTPTNTPIQSINSGEAAILWGTGLGPVPGDPAEACPFPCEVDAAVEILVGGVRVTTILYAGRSPQFAGLDQINFIVPPGVLGCYVPVVVVVDGVPSNYTTISIAESGAVCAEPDGFTAQELQQFVSDGQVRTGSVTVSRIAARFELAGMVEDLVLDSASGAFSSHPSQTFHSAAPPVEFLNEGACWVYSFQNLTAEFEDPVRPVVLDAGPELMLRGPRAARAVPKTGNGGYLAFLFNSGGPPIPGTGPSPYVEPGSHVLTGPGGADIGAFEARSELGEPLTWTNRSQIQDVTKSAGLTVTWNGGDPANEWVRIFGSSIVGADSSPFGAAFFCRASVADGSFTVGPEVLRHLPDTDPQGFSGTLRVGSSSRPAKFTASGLDMGWFVTQVMNSRNVTYE